MYIETEGIILKQIKAANGRRMVLLFSKKNGKISAGTGMNERGRNRSALAIRPFTHGKYSIYKSYDSYNINTAEVIKAYYKIGEDIDKYMCASFILEFTEKLLPEDMPSPELFKLLLDFFDLMENRMKKYMTPAIAFQMKAIQIMGMTPEIMQCVSCGKKEGLAFFSVRDGGTLCGDCRNININNNDELIYDINFDTINALRYFLVNNLKSIENIALNEEILTKLQKITKEYRAYHLSMAELLSEDFLKID